jgi:ribosomal protein S18 acetylase RimI-like enzyme
MDIRRLGPRDVSLLQSASHLFDDPPQEQTSQRFLSSADHHLLVALDGADPVGFVSGVEVTHPDKGTEMFLYELAVGEPFRRRGIGRQLVAALAELARSRGCYGMWVLTDADNVAAVATYTAAGAQPPTQHVLFNWTFS